MLRNAEEVTATPSGKDLVGALKRVRAELAAAIS
jgi:hypothetical protein